MCGIAAIFGYHLSASAVDQAELLRIREAMLNRGPDGAGLWVSDDKRIGLAHRRLAINDLSEAGAQPMVTPDGALSIVFNGEIYNFRELRAGLEARGYRFRSKSDTEVLLHLYQQYGRDMVQHLRGMYAFAIWDEKKRGLFLARDPFGIKPLYYADNGSTIRVASQVKALLKGGQIDTAPEPAGHVGFYLWGHVPEPYTLHKGIRALPAGTTLWIDASGRKEAKQFFNIAHELANASATRLVLTPDEMRERVREALLDSVRHHLIADVPVGAFLSAGLDSSTLVALAKEAGLNDLHTVTLGVEEFRGTRNDEVPLAELVAGLHSTIHRTRWVAKEDFQTNNQYLLDVMDQPTIDGVNTFFVSKAAKDAGLKVALSGVGGDELFGGYPSFQQIPRMVKAFSPFQAVPSLGKTFRYLSASILKRFTSPKYAGLLEYGGTYGGAYLLRRGMYMPWELPELLDGEMVRQGWAELQTLSRLEQTTQGVKRKHLKIAALETTWYLRNQLLRDIDWASMAHSLEVRAPLVDIDLFRALSPLFNSSSAPRKLMMAETPKLPLLQEIKNRPKTGFFLPLQRWSMEKAGGVERGLKGWAKHIIVPTKTPQNHILALVTDAFGGHGGIALYNRDFLKALCSHPNVAEVTAFPRLITKPLEDQPEKLTYVTESARGNAHYLLKVLQYLFKKPRIDLIVCAHVNLLPMAIGLGLLFRSPVLLEIYGIEVWQPTKSRLKNYLVRRVDAIVSISDVTKQRFLTWADYPEEKIFLSPNAIHAELYGVGPKNPTLLERHRLDGKVVLMTLGRLVSEERYKGFDQVLEILQVLAQSIPNVAYLIAGTGTDKRRLEEKSLDLGISDRVVFAGMISQEEKADYYRLADVFILASQGEGFGFVLLEAMACGIPVIASKLDGGREAVLEGEIGALVDPTNAMDLINAINVVLRRPERQIPDRLKYFRFQNFEKRIHRITTNVIDGKNIRM